MRLQGNPKCADNAIVTLGMKRFISTRAKLESVSDPTNQFFAWVADVKGSRLHLKVDNGPKIDPGSVFSIQLSSNRSSSNFDIEFMGMESGNCVFHMPELIRMEPPIEQARRRAGVKTATIKATDVIVDVIDVGPKGIGILASESYDSETELDLVLDTVLGDIQLSAKVVYSRFEETGFRTGLTISKIGRIDEARWNQLLAA